MQRNLMDERGEEFIVREYDYYSFHNHEIETLLEKIKSKILDSKHGIELEEREDEIIIRFMKKKTKDEKLALLSKLAGTGLQHGPEFIKDSLSIASREDEDDREGLFR